MKRLSWVAAALVMALCGLPRAEAQVPRGTYRGTAATTVRFINPATGLVTATRRYSRKVTVKIQRPVAGDPNPFTLTVAPTTAGAVPVAGDFFTASSRLVPRGTAGGGFRRLDYWTLSEAGTGFSGDFTNSHFSEGFARDRLLAPLARPAGQLKPHRFYDSGNPTFQVFADATVEGTDMDLIFEGSGYVLFKSQIEFETKIDARKKP